MDNERRHVTDEERKQANAARAAYYREYRKKNKEKVKEASMRYWLKKSQKVEEN